MTEIEFINIINDDKKMKIVSMFQDKEICMYIVNNNLFWKNIDLIIEKLDQELIITSMQYLSWHNLNFLSYNVVKFFKCSFDSSFYASLFKLIHKSNLNLFSIHDYILDNNLLNKCSYALFNSMYKNNNKEKLFNNLEVILKNSYKLLEIKKEVYGDLKFSNKIDEFIDNNINNIVYNIIMSSTGMTKEEIEEEKIFDFVKAIIDEVLINENKKYSDITYLDEGSSSVVYLIGDKVIKLGCERYTFKIENNKRFLKPLIRTNIKSLKNNETLFCIEITEKVDSKNISEEDTYFIYEELRDLGLVWGDAHPRNLGRLIKKNKIYFRGPINPTKESINYNSDLDIELDKDDLVILDNEFIYEEEEFNEKMGFAVASDLVKEFEARYQAQKRRKNY